MARGPDGGHPWRLRRFTLIVGRLTLAAVGVLLLVGVAELVARATLSPEPDRRSYDPYAYKILTPGLVDRFRVSNEVDEWVTVTTNSLGLRGPEIEPKRGIRLVFLGGSTTENYRFNAVDTFPFLIARRIEEDLGRPVEAFNAGLSGATTAHSLSRLQHHLLALEPDAVIVYHAVNDLLAGFAKGWEPTHRHLRPPVPTAPRSRLLTWIRGAHEPDFTVQEPYAARADLPPLPTGQPVHELRSLPVFERNVRSIAAIGAAHDVRVIFLTQASTYGQAQPARLALARSLSASWSPVPDVDSLARGMNRFNRVLARTEGTYAAHVYDLAGKLPRTPDIIYDDCHLTKRGNRLMAEIVAPAIRAVLLGPMPESESPPSPG